MLIRVRLVEGQTDAVKFHPQVLISGEIHGDERVVWNKLCFCSVYTVFSLRLFGFTYASGSAVKLGDYAAAGVECQLRGDLT